MTENIQDPTAQWRLFYYSYLEHFYLSVDGFFLRDGLDLVGPEAVNGDGSFPLMNENLFATDRLPSVASDLQTVDRRFHLICLREEDKTKLPQRVAHNKSITLYSMLAASSFRRQLVSDSVLTKMI